MARVRRSLTYVTTNLLYLSHGLISEAEFEPARELRIDEMWNWSGKSWGGLPDGTSIVNRPTSRPKRAGCDAGS